MIAFRILPWLFACALCGSTAASLEVMTVSDGVVDCDHPAIAQSPQMTTLVAWEDANHEIWTVFLPAPPTPGGDREYLVPFHNGDGHSPCNVPRRMLTGPALAWARPHEHQNPHFMPYASSPLPQP